MNIHLFFDGLAATLSLGATYFLSRRALSVGFARIEFVGNLYYVGLLLGAVWGAFFFGTLNLWLSGVDTIGRSILGALVGAILMVEILKAIKGETGSTGSVFVFAFTISTIIGRIGCFLAGLPDQTHGIKTAFFTGYDFGDDPRHPVQLYESASMLVFLVLMLALLRRYPASFNKYGFYLLCIWYGGQRFIWEFLKPYGKVLGPFNIFHLCAAALLVYGLWMIFNAQRRA